MANQTDFDWSLYEIGQLAVANFIVAADGRWTDENGSSRGLSNEFDREILVRLRNSSDAVLVGGNTARAEKYVKTIRFKTYVVTRAESLIPEGLIRLQPTDDDDLARQFESLVRLHGGLLVEAGPSLLRKLCHLGQIDRVFLTVVGAISEQSEALSKLLNIDGFKLAGRQAKQDSQFLVFDREAPGTTKHHAE